jgi:hypothetical protein
MFQFQHLWSRHPVDFRILSVVVFAKYQHERENVECSRLVIRVSLKVRLFVCLHPRKRLALQIICVYPTSYFITIIKS